MRATLIILLLTCVANLINGQDNFNAKKAVGFGCYFGGEETAPVVKMTKMLISRQYRQVSELLESGNGAERYLAVVSLEKLSAMGQYQISSTEKKSIEEIKSSPDKVSVCSGCTYFDKVSLKHMFSQDNFLGSNWWIEKTLERE